VTQFAADDFAYIAAKQKELAEAQPATAVRYLEECTPPQEKCMRCRGGTVPCDKLLAV